MASDRKLFVATHGNGAFRRDLLEPTTSTKELVRHDFSLKIFPNPVEDILNYEFSSSDSRSAQVSVYSIDGKMMIGKQIIVGTNSQKKELSVKALMPGNYVLHIENGIHSTSKIFVKK